jgi:hypothetical protein
MECIAVGSDVKNEGLILRGNPTSWSAAQMRQVSLGKTNYPTLNGVACPSTVFCVAYGSDSYPNARALFLVGNPSKWANNQEFYVASSPSPSQVESFSSEAYSLSAVDVQCVSSVSCVAIGSDNVGDPVFESGQPQAWKGHATLWPTASSNLALGSFDALACVATTCFVFGAGGTKAADGRAAFVARI